MDGGHPLSGCPLRFKIPFLSFFLTEGLSPIGREGKL
jgi:hypothetical protein